MSDIEKAKEFLTDLLYGKVMYVKEIQEQARKAGIGKGDLKTAKKELNILTHTIWKEGQQSNWVWFMLRDEGSGDTRSPIDGR